MYCRKVTRAVENEPGVPRRLEHGAHGACGRCRDARVDQINSPLGDGAAAIKCIFIFIFVIIVGRAARADRRGAGLWAAVVVPAHTRGARQVSAVKYLYFTFPRASYTCVLTLTSAPISPLSPPTFDATIAAYVAPIRHAHVPVVPRSHVACALYSSRR